MADCDWSYEIKWHLFLRREAVTNLGCMLKSRSIPLPTRTHIVRAMFLYFSVVMCQCKLYHKGGWTLRNWYFWTAILEKTLVSPLGCKEINPVNPKGKQSWKFTGGTDAEAEASILWLSNVRRQLMGKHSDVGKDWSRRRGCKRTKWLDGITDPMNLSLSKLWEMVKDKKARYAASMGLWRAGDDWVTEQQITTSNNKATECVWPWVVSGALEACHRSETLDSGKRWMCLTES